MLTTAMPRVLLVDDDHAFRLSLRSVLETEDVNVVGEAHDGDTAIELAESLLPDVVLMDAYMPGTDGFASCKAIRDKFPYLPIVILTGVAPDEDRNNAQLAGATAWVDKTELDDIADVIREVVGAF
jgi:CheY-like chemotaxis protein